MLHFLGPMGRRNVCAFVQCADEIFGEIRPLQENGAGTWIGMPVDGSKNKTMTPEDDIVSSIDDPNTLLLRYT
jgi:hypothetical protein